MLLSDILRDLSYGELSQIAIGSNEAGSINPDNYPQVISYINRGITEIYKRFSLKTKTISLSLQADVFDYDLTVAHAVTNTASNETKYIIDTAADPFIGDVLQVLAVYNGNGDELSVNITDDPLSVFTPSPNKLRIPKDSALDTYQINFRAYPVKLDINTSEPTTIEVDLPDVFAEALYLYVAHVAYLRLHKAEPENGPSFFTRFAAALRVIEDNSLINTESLAPNKFDNNGWV